MSVQVSYKKQTVFFIILIFITLVIAEGIVRYFFWFTDLEQKCEFTKHELFKDLTFFEKRSLCDEYTTIVYDRTDVIQRPVLKQGKHVNINSDGFRGKEFDFQPDDYKIFLLGGSTAFGSSSNDDFTIPALLEKKLNDVGLDVKVINAGVNAADSRDERYYIEKYIIKYSPDMIILYDGLNDARPLVDNFTYDQFKSLPYYDRLIAADEKLRKTGIITFFAKIDYKTGIGIAKYLSSILYDQNKIVIPNERQSEVEDRLQNNWSEICEMGEENNFQTINILQPVLGTGNRTLSEFEKYSTVEFYNSYLIAFKLDNTKYHPCDKVYDLRNVFDGMDGVTIYFDNGHIIDFGNQIVANNIYEKILPVILEDISN